MTPIKHNRPFIFHFRGDGNKGGVTVVFSPTTNRWGIAVCSKKDNFCRKLGRKIAQGRAECPVLPVGYKYADYRFVYGTACVENVISYARELGKKFATDHKITLTST